jgi:galactokinase
LDLTALHSQFITLYGPGPAPIAVAAPGRVNLIGEHTDYNEGFVCPMAIDRCTVVLARPRTDLTVKMHSNTSNQAVEFSIAKTVVKANPAWSLYARGVAEALRQKGLLQCGMDSLVDTDVPIGGGLSSSASFEVATGLALLTINNATMEPVDLALACQWAEHNYPGMPCGIMDQFISVLGQKGHALLLDCRDHSTQQVPLSDPTLRIVIANSNVKHELVQGEYTARRHQCETAVKNIQKRFPNVFSLRDATLDDLEDSRFGMDPTVYQRAHHVITEIARTTDFAAAMEKKDYPLAGKLMVASHESLRDDYAVSCSELDALVEIAMTVPGVYGARMTGGGFGGSIVALVKADAVPALTRKIDAEYPKKTGKKATVFATLPSQGAHVIN